MSTSQASRTQNQDITPPSSFARPLTPPRTDEKQFQQAHRVLALYESIRDGKHIHQESWVEFQLIQGEYDEIERRLDRDKELLGFVHDKIQFDYDAVHHRLTVRMPTAIHELFVARVEDAIHSQLKSIREGSSRVAIFAKKVQPARSTAVSFPVDDARAGSKSKREPDASFWHDNAEYPGVVIEVAYSQKKKRLNRLAEDYLLDSDANIRTVIGLDIEYGKRRSRLATLSMWRTEIIHTADEGELRVVQEVKDEPFRDEQGKPTDHPGLRLHLSDFANNGLVQEEIGDQDRDLIISAQKLCEFLTAAETKVHQKGSLSKDSLGPRISKRKRSESPPDEILSEDERKFAEQAEKAVKRMARGDSDYN